MTVYSAVSSTRASVTRTETETVVRDKIRSACFLALTAIAFLAACGTGIAVVGQQAHSAVPMAIAMPLANAVVCYLGWLFAFRTSVRLRTEGIVIENLIVRFSIPWRQGRQFYMRKRPRAASMRLRLLDGRTYSVVAFQATIVSAAAFASFDPVVEQLAAESDRIVTAHLPEYPPPATSWRLQFPDWWVIPAVILASEAVVWLTYAA